jgi:nitrite reductase/ring-hydroxylating ferredoxin subunit/DMSO/TMAO reductase YedYZ heme-binding membrane subunit
VTVGYKAVGWNRQKKIYDLVVVGGLLAYLGAFVGTGLATHPQTTIETLLIRALGTAALFLLHVILAIGPLCRLHPAFLPLLYNRRHLGIIMFATAFGHGAFSMLQFHALGDVNPLVSVLTSNGDWGSVAQFPFQPLGLAALLILFLMAATSHDFWLANLTAPTWKRLHMGVYVAYALTLLHVTLGVLQQETHPALAIVLLAGMLAILALHLAAALGERAGDVDRSARSADGYVDFCALSELPEDRAAIRSVGGERVSVFRHGGALSALSNVCQHQNGPLGEGRVVNGCAVCPWHGYEYRLEDGASPAPFTEKVPTFRVRVDAGRVLVDPQPNPPGTSVAPCRLEDTPHA